MKSLVIAEKPSVGKDIAKVLKCTRNINGAINGEKGKRDLYHIKRKAIIRISTGGLKKAGAYCFIGDEVGEDCERQSKEASTYE